MVLLSLFFSSPLLAQEVTKTTKYSMVKIPKGSFVMNDCDNGGKQDPYCPENIIPHKVEITYDYFIMQSEVTRGLYKELMGTDPSFFSTGSTKNCTSCPVESVTWIDSLTFANALSKSEGLEECYTISEAKISWKGLECKGWRLPTEAEWEYAARAPALHSQGARAKDELFAARADEQYRYAGSDDKNKVGWFEENSPLSYATRALPHAKCSKPKNAWELCDMTGNVSEWTWDVFSTAISEYPELSKDPVGYTGKTKGQVPYRIIKGFDIGSNCRNPCDDRCDCVFGPPECKRERCSLAEMDTMKYYEYSNTVGFRLVRTAN